MYMHIFEVKFKLYKYIDIKKMELSNFRVYSSLNNSNE